MYQNQGYLTNKDIIVKKKQSNLHFRNEICTNKTQFWYRDFTSTYVKAENSPMQQKNCLK